MQWIKKAWRGEEKLWKVFWIYGVLGNIILNSLLRGIGNLLFIIIVPYFIWVLVSEWRCAFNVKLRFWGYVVRILVILAAFSPFITCGMLVGRDLIHAAECRKAMMDEGRSKGLDAKQYAEQHHAEILKCIDEHVHHPSIEQTP